MDNGQSSSFNLEPNSSTSKKEDFSTNPEEKPENHNLDLTNENMTWNVVETANNAEKQGITAETVDNLKSTKVNENIQKTPEETPSTENAQKLGEVVNLDYMPPNYENKETAPNQSLDPANPDINESIDSKDFSEKKYSISPEALKVTIRATEEFNKGEIVPDKFYKIVRQNAVKKYIKHSFKREVAAWSHVSVLVKITTMITEKEGRNGS